MKFGSELTYSKMGVLCIGARLESQQEGLDRVYCLFDKTELPYVREKDILHRLWSKFMLNVGVNQTCMVYSCTYGDVWRPGKERDTMAWRYARGDRCCNAEGLICPKLIWKNTTGSSARSVQTEHHPWDRTALPDDTLK